MKQLHFAYFLNVREMIKKKLQKFSERKMALKSKIQHETNGELKTVEFHKPLQRKLPTETTRSFSKHIDRI